MPTVIDAAAFVRRRPGMYGLSDPPAASELAWRLVGDALASGCGVARAERHGPWWVVSGDRDWIACAAGRTLEDLFAHPAPFPAGGVNSTRSEAVVTAFAAAVATRVDAAPWDWISGGPADRRTLDAAEVPPAARVVAFRPDPTLTR